MHDDLVKRLRASVDGRYEKCDGCPYEEDYPCCVDCFDKMHKQAAEAIEELSEQLLEMGQVGKFLLDVHKINSKMVAPESVPTDSEWREYKAIPVPPHGRLIDADALADIFRGFIAMYDSCPFSQLSFPDKARRDELQSALAEVINAPTIIPASEEGET